MSSVKHYIEHLTELDESTKLANASFDVILDCVLKPLTWISELNPQQQLEFLFHKAWKQHVWHIYHDILPLWAFSFSNKTPLFDTLFLTSCSDQIRVNMARTSLPILIECVSAQTDFGTLEIYAQALKLVCFSPLVAPYYALYIPKLDVRFFCSLLCSVPTQLANVFGVQLEEIRFNANHEWYIERYKKKRMFSWIKLTIFFFLQKILCKGESMFSRKSIQRFYLLHARTFRQNDTTRKRR